MGANNIEYSAGEFATAVYIKGGSPTGIQKNVSRTMMYKMVDATDFATPETGVATTVEVSLDGAAFVNCAETKTEISDGWYKITLTAAHMNADEIIFKATGAGCAQCDRLIVTES